MPHRIRASVVLLLAAAGAWAAGGGVRIAASGEGFRLLRNGEQYAIRGAAGNPYLERLAEAGGNSVRGGAELLDRAHVLGLSVLVELLPEAGADGFDYADARQFTRRRETVRRQVLEHKDHPAVLMWSLGDELESRAGPAGRPAMWAEINSLAALIRETDGRHPVIASVGPAYKRMLPEIDRHCPNLDAAGVSAGVDLLTLADDIARLGWKRPYVVTGFGPRGDSEVARTSWQAPIENTSTEKADFYVQAWRRAVEGRPHCLGAYVTLWAHSHHPTPTWYGMFLEDGSATGAVDAMTWLWTGRWPANRSPRIGPRRMRVQQVGASDDGTRIYGPGSPVLCEVEAADPDADPLAYGWEIRPDAVAGSGAHAVPVAVRASSAGRAILRLPKQPGRYRVFVYVRDGRGGAATANVPVLVASGAR